MEFFRDVCICLPVFAFALFCFFTFVSISGHNFVSSSKDTAATTAPVDLVIGTITVLLYLTLKIAYYLREISVQ